MTLEEKGILFRKRFLQESLGQMLQTRNEYGTLFNVLNEENLISLDELNVFFCRSYAPSVMTELKNVPELETLRLIIFEGKYLTKLSPSEVVAIFLHEIGHAFNPSDDLQQSEFNADDFAISKGYGKHIKSSLLKLIESNAADYDNEINRNRLERL